MEGLITVMRDNALFSILNSYMCNYMAIGFAISKYSLVLISTNEILVVMQKIQYYHVD